MPKRLFRKWAPDPHQLKQHEHLQFLGKALHHPWLWQFNRHTVSKAFLGGVFAMWMPIPFQSVLAAVLAIFSRANLPISVALVFVSNPFTMPAMVYAAYKIGALALGQAPIAFEPSLEGIMQSMELLWKPFVVGNFIMAAITAVISYYAIRVLWRFKVLQNLKQRKARLHERKQQMLDTVFKALPEQTPAVSKSSV
jgi:hypothetical protein